MAITGILVPLDGAGIAATVLPTVAALARPIGAAVHLMASVDLSKREIASMYYTLDAEARPGEEETAPLAPAAARASQAVARRRVERASGYLAELARRMQALGIESSYEAAVGDPMTDIVRLARRKRFGLIALTPHSRYAIGRGLGSVTDRVLHSSPIPLLIAPPTTDSSAGTRGMEIGAVVVPLDGTRAAEAAFGPARQIARAHEAELVLIRAIGGRARQAAWAAGAARVGRDIEADFQADVRRYLEDAAGRAAMPCATLVGGEDEVTEILSVADGRPSSMIVMASQGRSGLTKWQLGSVSDRIVRQSRHPVIVVPSILNR